MNELRSNPERTARVIEELVEWYRGSRDGVLSGAELPESKPPEGVTRGSYEHTMFLTLAIAIDYQRSADALWNAARETWEDPTTRWVFMPSEIANRSESDLKLALSKYKLSKKQDKDAKIWRTVALSFLSLFEGDPRKLFEKYSYNAYEIWKAMREVYGKRFPYLAGSTGTSKILSLWIRMLRDEAGVEFTHLNDVPLPVDIHTARASITTGCLVGNYSGSFNELVTQVKQAWKEACENMKYYPLQVDEPLWNLSRFGCSNRKNGMSCPKKNQCRLSAFCVANDSNAVITISQTGLTIIDTKYPKGDAIE